MTMIISALTKLVAVTYRLLQALAALDEPWEVREIARIEALVEDLERRRDCIEVAA